MYWGARVIFSKTKSDATLDRKGEGEVETEVNKYFNSIVQFLSSGDAYSFCFKLKNTCKNNVFSNQSDQA